MIKLNNFIKIMFRFGFIIMHQIDVIGIVRSHLYKNSSKKIANGRNIR